MVKDGTSSSSGIKKKRKTAATEAEAESDIYKKVIQFEEKEASMKQGSAEATLYFELCQDIRKNLTELLDLKVKDPNSNKLKDIQTEIFLKICFIKKLNRTDKIRHVFGKEALATEKQKCDSIKLNYQNLVYELYCLLSETDKCLAFKSKDEEIELVPLEEFMRDAPESLTKKFESYDSNDREQTHSLRLARLEWELTQRKNLAKLCKSLDEEKKKLEQDLVERKDKLNAVRPLLLNIINSTKPLQQHLDLSLKEMRVEHKLAHLLPDPLYIFYVNVVSYKHVTELNLDVEIIGDQDEALQWVETEHEGSYNDDESDVPEPDQDNTEVEEVVEVKKRRHRKSVQVDLMEEKRKKLLETHPLKIQIVAKLKASTASLTVTFAYQTRLKIITVTSSTSVPSEITGNCANDVLTGENILSELIDGDLGIDSPNPITKFQIKKVGVTSFQSLISQTGYAYHWAQRICGIDFLSKQMKSDAIATANVETVIKILFKRLQSRIQLANQLQQLEQNIFPKLPDSLDCPSNSICSLTKWISITYQKYCDRDFTQTFVEEELVSPSDLFYSLQLTRGNATLEALVVIKNNYPQTLPIFSICVKYNGLQNSLNNDEVREMERLLNVCSDNNSSMTLSIQILKLRSYFDIYLETTDSKAFPQTVTFIRSISARNRKRPFKFRNMGNGIFTQY